MSQAVIFRFDFYDTPFQKDHGLKQSTLSCEKAKAYGHFYIMYHHYQFI